MKKDIFIDNNIAKNFTEPKDEAYKNLIRWLMEYDKNKPEPDENDAFLVVSQKLLVEYIRSSQHNFRGTSINLITKKLQAEGRLLKIGTEEIKAFKKQHFTPKILKQLKCNEEDRDLIPIVLLSDRKFGLSLDQNFTNDLYKIPGFAPTIADRPENLPYTE